MNVRRAIAILGLVLLGLPGCYQELPIDDPDGSSPPWDAAAYDSGAPDSGIDAGRPDAGPDAGMFVPPPGDCVEPVGVDLLFMVDGSNSMTEEQANLAAGLPVLIEQLITPPDLNGDMQPDWLPVENLQVGVITPDLGSGGFLVPTCDNADFGDDGLLRTIGDTSQPGCMPSYPTFLGYDPAGSVSATEFAAEVACVTTVGTGGCGFEQQLEATLKALSPDMPTAATGPGYAPPRFFGDTTGHALGANAGFVRDDTLLAIVLVTDEGDCSASDPELFNPTSTTYVADLNLRCARHPEALHPVTRYAEGFAALRASRLDLLAFALIAGVPTDLAMNDPSDADFQRILDDPRMQEMVDPMMPTRLVPSCNEPGTGFAFPPRRMVEVARGLTGARSTVQSICQPDLGDATASIARLIGRRACETYEVR